MAALVLGLGGKPSTLNRGNSAKEYIQTGCNSAEISITFGNTGPEAYKPELFGNELTVERSLSASGPSKYKIKSSKGKKGLRNEGRISKETCFFQAASFRPVSRKSMPFCARTTSSWIIR